MKEYWRDIWWICSCDNYFSTFWFIHLKVFTFIFTISAPSIRSHYFGFLRIQFLASKWALWGAESIGDVYFFLLFPFFCLGEWTKVTKGQTKRNPAPGQAQTELQKIPFQGRTLGWRNSNMTQVFHNCLIWAGCNARPLAEWGATKAKLYALAYSNSACRYHWWRGEDKSWSWS